MFTPEDRAQLRSALLERAAGDERISGAAITGSAATGLEDQWSDVDLAFGVRAGAELSSVLADWTTHMYDQLLALHHVDMLFGAWTYRVFLLSNTLQVDLAFVVDTEFRALSTAFRLIFGKANEAREASPRPVGATIGMAWLYALHARSAIARGKLWQAEYMISGVRDHALALACVRLGLPPVHGRGIDMLPVEVMAPFENSLVRRLEAGELERAFGVVMDALVAQVEEADPELAAGLGGTLRILSATSG